MKYEITYFPKQIISEKIYDLLISEGIDLMQSWITSSLLKVTMIIDKFCLDIVIQNV